MFYAKIDLRKICKCSEGYSFYPPRGLPPHRGEEVCAPHWPGEQCWSERKLLVVTPIPDRSKGRGQMKCSPWCSMLGFGRGSNEFTVTKPGRRPRPTQTCSGSKNKNILSIQCRTTWWSPEVCISFPSLAR
jgi:hypothetical protein